jgi:ADP-ribosylglycohydrolase
VSEDPKRSKYTGCLFGLAIGDALGGATEFLKMDEIRECYGPEGVTDFQPRHSFPPGWYTDDTQMSLATAEGCIRAHQNAADESVCHVPSVIYQRYLAWFESQNDPVQRRGPGMTCLTALALRQMGTIEEPFNDSKGCGGVMRVAPIGLAYPVELAFREGAEVAALTHGHPSGYLSAGVLAEAIARIVAGQALASAFQQSCAALRQFEGHGETLEKLDLAFTLCASDEPDLAAIERIGEGWVGEEALGIALLCALRHRDDFSAGVLVAANHSGDSDSTASICGAIQNRDGIRQLADDMYRAFVKNETLAFEGYPPD